MKHVTVRKRCPKCKKGELLATGLIISNSTSTLYENECDSCFERIQLDKGYPEAYNEYEESEIWEHWEK